MSTTTSGCNQNTDKQQQQQRQRQRQEVTTVHVWRAVPLFVYLQVGAIEIVIPYGNHTKHNVRSTARICRYHQSIAKSAYSAFVAKYLLICSLNIKLNDHKRRWHQSILRASSNFVAKYMLILCIQSHKLNGHKSKSLAFPQSSRRLRCT